MYQQHNYYMSLMLHQHIDQQHMLCKLSDQQWMWFPQHISYKALMGQNRDLPNLTRN
jgi:hypothetical protein